jgi:hypothetical protein
MTLPSGDDHAVDDAGHVVGQHPAHDAGGQPADLPVEMDVGEYEAKGNQPLEYLPVDVVLHAASVSRAP